MTDKQPEALRLAYIIEGNWDRQYGKQVAAELRRLQGVNAELVEALEMVIDDASLAKINPVRLYMIEDKTLKTVHAALTKAQGEE
jgi:hypothetical protein